MARELRPFDVTIPAGTAQTATAVTDLTMPPRDVRRVTVTVPPGPSGLVGFRLTMSGVPVIPATVDGWIIADGRVIPWDLTDYPDSGAWQLEGYNTDIFDHTLYLEFECDLPAGVTALKTTTPIPASVLTSAPPAG